MGLYFKKQVSDDILVGIWEIVESTDELIAITRLNESDKIIFENFSSENRKKQWISTRALTQVLIGKDTRIEYTEFGKPYLAEKNFGFSISHSGRFAAIMINKNSACGIDIENISPKLEKVKHKFLNPSEYSLNTSKNEIEQLCVIWGVKESIYKMEGSKSLNFSKEIIVTSKIKEEKGEIKAEVRQKESIKHYTLQYEKVDDFMLVNTL